MKIISIILLILACFQLYNAQESPKLNDQYAFLEEDELEDCSEDEEGDGGLSKGAIAGIVIGVVAGTAIIAAGVLFVLIKKKKVNLSEIRMK